ncbi:amino acid/polyamine transporter I [Schizophyllum amplum]|uniref:Amino acid/polyamine transporter I n=1 Tax=Schizophyllum amplum TaxID=97359 RepID=A0A550C5F9_9AGAR|nr:amino acid/polyamine transporter I [Auriculariopsis ampla]
MSATPPPYKAPAAAAHKTSANDDDQELIDLGYVPSFKREFTNLATISFAFSIMGLCSSISTTFVTPLTTGGPAAVVWCWILGACMCFTLGSSIAEIVSAYPTCGGLYTASANLSPKKYRARIGWLVGWLNILGQIAGVSSTEFGLSNMIWAAVSVGKDGNYTASSGQVVGLFAGLLALHGILNSVGTRHLARFTSGFVFVNIGATFLIIIVLLATTPRSEMHAANYVFGSAGIVNGTGGWNTGIAFLLGLLSVQWTMTDYDATAHISEEVRRAAYAVIGTGVIGWLFNIVLVLCSGPMEDIVAASNPVLEIMALRMGKAGALVLWVPVCLTAFFVVQTALQATSRTVFAFSRDHGLPDGGYFGRNTKYGIPLNAIWISTLVSFIPGLLDLASPIAANAIFSLTAMALDLSYVIPIFLRRVFANHPDVMFKPGPFYMGDGIVGLAANVICISWTVFIIVIFSLPTVRPVTSDNMNYASVITVGVMFLSALWYVLGGHKHYNGPQSNLHQSRSLDGVDVVGEENKTDDSDSNSKA